VTTPPPEATQRQRLSKFLGALGDQATAVNAVLPVFAIILYAVLRIAYTVFYEPFGLSPDDLGFGYLDLLVQSALGIVLLLVWLLILVGFLLLLVMTVGLLFRTPEWLDRRLRGTWPFISYLVFFLVLTALLILSAYKVVPSVVPYALIYCVGALTLPVGVRIVRDGLRGAHASQWRGGMVGVAAFVLIVGIGVVIAEAAIDRSQVRHGHPAELTYLGFPITGWRADDATVTWTNSNVAGDLASLAGRCLLYFGQSAGTAYFYRSENRQVLRISTQDVVIRTGRGVCTGKQ
jgi:hypothetical protein